MHFHQWKRRAFISLLGGAAAWPIAARAQPSQMPVIGFLNNTFPERMPHILTGFRRGLHEVGYVEQQNVAIEYRWARGQYDRLPALATDLVARGVSVIVAGGELPARAAMAATATAPIVFVVPEDPVKLGLVASLNRPGGNLTGVVGFTSVVETKKLGLLLEMLPRAARIAMLINPKNPPAESDAKEVETAAKQHGRQIQLVRASDDQQVEAAFLGLAGQRPDALLVAGDPFFNSNRERIVALAAQISLPAIYEFREFVSAGGLMSYGASLPVPVGNSRSDILVMEAAQNGQGQRLADGLDGARDWRITSPVIGGCGSRCSIFDMP
jgi:putative ABC transport system substrate-binding protein